MTTQLQRHPHVWGATDTEGLRRYSHSFGAVCRRQLPAMSKRGGVAMRVSLVTILVAVIFLQCGSAQETLEPPGATVIVFDCLMSLPAGFVVDTRIESYASFPRVSPGDYGAVQVGRLEWDTVRKHFDVAEPEIRGGLRVYWLSAKVRSQGDERRNTAVLITDGLRQQVQVMFPHPEWIDLMVNSCNSTPNPGVF